MDFAGFDMSMYFSRTETPRGFQVQNRSIAKPWQVVKSDHWGAKTDKWFCYSQFVLLIHVFVNVKCKSRPTDATFVWLIICI